MSRLGDRKFGSHPKGNEAARHEDRHQPHAGGRAVPGDVDLGQLATKAWHVVASANVQCDQRRAQHHAGLGQTEDEIIGVKSVCVARRLPRRRPRRRTAGTRSRAVPLWIARCSQPRRLQAKGAPGPEIARRRAYAANPSTTMCSPAWRTRPGTSPASRIRSCTCSGERSRPPSHSTSISRSVIELSGLGRSGS